LHNSFLGDSAATLAPSIPSLLLPLSASTTDPDPDDPTLAGLLAGLAGGSESTSTGGGADPDPEWFTHSLTLTESENENEG
jgi:hypothetical protein